MPKKGENIYKRKDGRWEGRYIKGYLADGKAKYAYVYGKTYFDVNVSRRLHIHLSFVTKTSTDASIQWAK